MSPRVSDAVQSICRALHRRAEALPLAPPGAAVQLLLRISDRRRTKNRAAGAADDLPVPAPLDVRVSVPTHESQRSSIVCLLSVSDDGRRPCGVESAAVPANRGLRRHWERSEQPLPEVRCRLTRFVLGVGPALADLPHTQQRDLSETRRSAARPFHPEWMHSLRLYVLLCSRIALVARGGGPLLQRVDAELHDVAEHESRRMRDRLRRALRRLLSAHETV